MVKQVIVIGWEPLLKLSPLVLFCLAKLTGVDITININDNYIKTHGNLTTNNAIPSLYYILSASNSETDIYFQRKHALSNIMYTQAHCNVYCTHPHLSLVVRNLGVLFGLEAFLLSTQGSTCHCTSIRSGSEWVKFSKIIWEF